jgi:hypothetical protein
LKIKCFYGEKEGFCYILAMKTIVCILLIMILGIPSIAQINEDRALYQQKVIKYTKMKNTGTALIVTGGILFTVGVIVLANSSITTYESGTGYTDTEGAPYFGAIATVVGMGGLGAGIPLAIVGSKSKRKYEAKLQALSLRIQANPKYSGLTLAYRF